MCRLLPRRTVALQPGALRPRCQSSALGLPGGAGQELASSATRPARMSLVRSFPYTWVPNPTMRGLRQLPFKDTEENPSPDTYRLFQFRVRFILRLLYPTTDTNPSGHSLPGPPQSIWHFRPAGRNRNNSWPSVSFELRGLSRQLPALAPLPPRRLKTASSRTRTHQDSAERSRGPCTAPQVPSLFNLLFSRDRACKLSRPHPGLPFSFLSSSGGLTRLASLSLLRAWKLCRQRGDHRAHSSHPCTHPTPSQASLPFLTSS